MRLSVACRCSASPKLFYVALEVYTYVYSSLYNPVLHCQRKDSVDCKSIRRSVPFSSLFLFSTFVVDGIHDFDVIYGIFGKKLLDRDCKGLNVQG